MNKDNRFCGYSVQEMQKYGLYEAIILHHLRWHFATIGMAFGGKKFYRTVAQIAEELGLSYNTVKKHLPTEQMGVRHYSGYIPGTIIKTSWWEIIDDSDSVCETNAKEKACETKSYYKEEDKEEDRGETLTLIHTSDSFSSKTNEQDSLATSKNNSARAAAPFTDEPIIDVSKVKRPKLSEDRKFTMELIELSGKKDKAGKILTGLVATQRKAYGDDVLREFCKTLKSDKYLCSRPLQKCLTDYQLNCFVNKDNKPAKQNWWDDDDEDAWGDLC